MASVTKKIIIIGIILLVLLNIKYEFLTTSTLDRLDLHKFNIFAPSIVKEATRTIGQIEEESLQRTNKALGGLDEVNATSDRENINRPRIQQEGFASNIYELQLFYKTTCGYSQQFLPIWYELTSALPNTPGVSYREYNCDKLDANGVSICAVSPNNISSVPTIRLRMTSPDGIDSTQDYTGPRSYKAISDWLASKGLYLMFNADMVAEGFADANMGVDIANKIISADGNIRKAYDKEWVDAAAMNEFGEFHDVQEGCYIASFSKCRENTTTPGYQIFTHRGQYGCVYPEAGTGISSDFDAAFTVADQYLSTCVPPKFDPDTGKEVVMTPAEKKSQMMKCAMKYRNQLRSFGLCNEEKLNEKYVTPDYIRQGKLKPPMPDMTAEDYQGAADSAEAIYTACSV